MQKALPERRGLAAVLDIVVLYLLHAGPLMYVVLGPDARTRSVLLGLMAVSVVLFLAYGALEVIGGAALGKRLLGLRIRSSTGAPASRRQLLLRWLCKFLPIAGWAGANVLLLAAVLGDSRPEILEAAAMASGTLILLAVADILFAAGPSGQALHDRVAATAVVDVRPAPL